jgi:hypothetical protein
MELARVIRIIDDFTIMIDKGYETGNLEEGTRITVFEPGPEIKDLDGNSLGKYDFTKANLIITEVFQRFSIAQNIEEGSPFSVTNFLSGGQTKLVINVNEDEIEPLEPKDIQVKKGDLVRIDDF